MRQFTALITDAMTFSGLEFTVPFDDAIELLTATHNHVHLESLFSGTLDSPDLHTLLHGDHAAV